MYEYLLVLSYQRGMEKVSSRGVELSRKRDEIPPTAEGAHLKIRENWYLSSTTRYLFTVPVPVQYHAARHRPSKKRGTE